MIGVSLLTNHIHGIRRLAILVGMASCAGCGGSSANGLSTGPAAANRPPSTPASKVAPETLSQLDDFGRKVVKLGGRPELHLDLSHTAVTDDDLANLEVLAMVTSMDLSHTTITDAGIEHLKKYPQLEKLTLVGIPITDASLEHFKQMPKLWYVYVNQVNMSQKGQLELVRQLAPRAQAVTRTRAQRASKAPSGPQ